MNLTRNGIRCRFCAKVLLSEHTLRLSLELKLPSRNVVVAGDVWYVDTGLSNHQMIRQIGSTYIGIKEQF